MLPRPRALLLAGGLLFALGQSAQALEYRSTSRPAVMYDAPSTAGAKVAIAGNGLPLEVIVNSGAWLKVRDHTGRLAWIEAAALDGPRTVMVKADVSAVRQQPRADAEVVFRAARGVLLEVTGNANAYGWIPVKHADGLAGWLPSHEVWGQ